METRYYETQEINIPPIAQALVVEYLAQGYKAQQFGDVNQTTALHPRRPPQSPRTCGPRSLSAS